MESLVWDAWFDEGEAASYPSAAGRPEGVATRGAKLRCGSLVYKAIFLIVAPVFASLFCTGCQTAQKSVRLMSFNVRMGCGHDNPFVLPKGSLGHLPQCADVIRREAPDVVGIQEIDRRTTRAGGMDQTAELARLCGMEGSFVCIGGIMRPRGETGGSRKRNERVLGRFWRGL